ncbi:MAG: NAD+ synthase [Desulfobacteraceae bacterium]|jgi:NAD+ synthetase
MKIALVQINPVIGDFERQHRNIIAYAERAKERGCDLVIFSEMVVCGYPPRDLLEQRAFIEANQTALESLVNTISGIGVVVGLVAANTDGVGKALLNSAVLFEDGRVLYQVNKQLLPTYDVFDEHRYFEPGQPNLPFQYKGLRLGLTICEDVWNDKDTFDKQLYAIDPVERLAKGGMDFLINIAASPFHLGKIDFRDKMLSAIAVKHQVPVAFVNQVGGNDHILFDGASAVYDSHGRVKARCADFREDLVVYDTQADRGDIHRVSDGSVETVLNALVMGTRDYVTKCGFNKAVIGLSGGIDSALTAFIAQQALGSENVATVFMPSKYTSRHNYEDTRAQARNLGLQYDVIPIDDIFIAFLSQLVPDADSRNPGLTEQNIQARIRGTLLMGISNRDGSLVLTTGNKSELAVGYCTLYGDMNGGLAVISDVPKTLVYEICRHINREDEVIPQRIIEKPPSAELAPGQTDQDDLPPYEVMDPILEAYVERALSREEIIAEGFDPSSVAEIIRRVDQNEYKRHQAAPGLKVTPKAFGEGRRYPLAKRFRPVIG